MNRDPRTRRFVTGDEAIKTKEQHTKPCADCPWGRTSISGWTGINSPEEWVRDAHAETKIMCHTATVQCAGAAIFRANVCKTPRTPDRLQLPADSVRVFANNTEFLNHHNREIARP